MRYERRGEWRGLGIGASLALVAWAWAACGGGDATGVPPEIFNINSTTDPASPVGLAIEINGTGFRSAPGRVLFAQSGNVAEVTPQASGWSETGIIVTVPSEGSGGEFTVPGTVAVTVRTSFGTSNSVDLELVIVPTFNVEDVRWEETTALPAPLAGVRAGVIPNTSASAYVIVAGGYDGTNNVLNVWSNTVAQGGQLGAAWTETTPLPAARAHHGIAVAHPQNSLVSVGSRYLYVIGGQAAADGAPGGTSTVYVASVSTADGSVGSWSTTSALPVSLVGPAVTVYNGYLYVVGGLLSGGSPSSAVYSARINSNGTLGSWATQSNAYPVGISFATAFGFGGNLYVLGGDVAESTAPNSQGSATGVKTVRYAPVRSGAVGSWTATSELIANRKKHIHWAAFGQIVAAEGLYDGQAFGSKELEKTKILEGGTLDSWTGLTQANQQIAANVYNAAAIVSPIRPADGGPRFLLLGGRAYSSTETGALQDKVYYNTAP